MKICVSIKHLILCPVFLVCIWTIDAGALTWLGQSKTVAIDENWEITGRYAYKFEISNPEDVTKIDHLIQQLNARTYLVSVAVYLPGGRKAEWTGIDKNKIPAGASIKIEFTISDIFPGFEGLFADAMRIDQATPVKKAAYRITFPEKTTFVCRFIVIDETGNYDRRNEFFNDGFSWSGDNVRRLDLTISTAASWQQIRDRYQALFQHQIGNKFAGMADLPTFLTTIDKAAPDDQKIQKVMNYFRTHFDYQQRAWHDHGLLPDDPAVVMHRGWGDCKDLALLETLILQSMGIDAFVVLSGKLLSKTAIPDPFIFDHAMVGADSNNRIAYYDSLAAGNIVTVNEENMYLHLKVSYDAQ